jgi:hypothetical protein
MPTFCKYGGRTLDGGDMMPFVIACPQAVAASSVTASKARAAEIELLYFVEFTSFHPFYMALSEHLRPVYRPVFLYIALQFSHYRSSRRKLLRRNFANVRRCFGCYRQMIQPASFPKS